ncbi:hypothetical protein PgNI_06535 [Pyricularia grisea]|uniref:Uncharacterized protein n=1 Tax=Pyricularia grisea TaxID=148305 RepID=A0A6P8B5R5_PYRGI|nr:hypothetical protein PgNI_06535 [Pyricularia grisea]TLD10637.1 hypothetical protein PgNI_06535 [Pyricularia grisea]
MPLWLARVCMLQRVGADNVLAALISKASTQPHGGLESRLASNINYCRIDSKLEQSPRRILIVVVDG